MIPKATSYTLTEEEREVVRRTLHDQAVRLPEDALTPMFDRLAYIFAGDVVVRVEEVEKKR